jgi:CRISPR-associated protein Cas6
MTTNGSTGEMVDLVFPALGTTVRLGHGYDLYGAVSRVVPAAHGATDLGIFPIGGPSAGDGTIQLTKWSALRLRLPAGRLPAFRPLAGRTLELSGHRIRLGVPTVAALVPAPTLTSDLVLIKLAHPGDEANAGRTVPIDAFLAAAAKQLAALDVAGTPLVQATLSGPRAGQPRRRVLKVKGQTHVGYAMVIDGLTADESLRVQARGLGGRRLMGCGLFLPGDKEGRHVRPL